MIPLPQVLLRIKIKWIQLDFEVSEAGLKSQVLRLTWGDERQKKINNKEQNSVLIIIKKGNKSSLKKYVFMFMSNAPGFFNKIT